MLIISGSVLMLWTKNYGSYSLPKLAHFLRHSAVSP